LYLVYGADAPLNNTVITSLRTADNAVTFQVVVPGSVCANPSRFAINHASKTTYVACLDRLWAVLSNGDAKAIARSVGVMMVSPFTNELYASGLKRDAKDSPLMTGPISFTCGHVPGFYVEFGSCVPCPRGQWRGLSDTMSNNGSGTAFCKPCNTGAQAPVPGAAKCADCPEGSYQDLSTKQCAPCLPGSKGNVSGLTKCFDCLPGEYANSGGAVSCTACEVGRYVSENRSISCVQCPQVRISSLLQFTLRRVANPHIKLFVGPLFKSDWIRHVRALRCWNLRKYITAHQLHGVSPRQLFLWSGQCSMCAVSRRNLSKPIISVQVHSMP